MPHSSWLKRGGYTRLSPCVGLGCMGQGCCVWVWLEYKVFACRETSCLESLVWSVLQDLGAGSRLGQPVTEA